MNMQANDFYDMLPGDFRAKVEGYKNRVYRERSDLRRAAFLVVVPHVQKVSYEKFCREWWPLAGDDFKQPEAIETPEKDFWEKVKESNKRISDVRRSKFAGSRRR